MEKLGQDASLRDTSAIELALAQAQLDPDIKAAILAKDQQRLERLLGGGNVCCALCPAEEEEDEGAEEVPSREDEDTASRSPARVVA
ncbi:hypothetical protein [Rhodanobacter lindaniclasticus]